MKDLNPKPKIFCISFQRTGTTSTGKFFKDHGYEVQGYNKNISPKWSKLFFQGNYEAIFEDSNFKNNQVFEDGPWWALDFYKFLYFRFPNAKFILLTREADKWFDSMVSHSKGKTLGNTFNHIRHYYRFQDFLKLNLKGNPYLLENLDNLLELNENHRENYKNIYNFRNNDVLNFFEANDRSRLITSTLESSDKWKRIAEFLNIEISQTYKVHANKSNK